MTSVKQGTVWISVLGALVSVISAAVVVYQAFHEAALTNAQVAKIENELAGFENNLKNLDAATEKIVRETDVIRFSNDLNVLRKLRPIIVVLPKVNDVFVSEAQGIIFQKNEHVVTNLGSFEVKLKDVIVKYICNDQVINRKLTGDSALMAPGYSLSVYPDVYIFPEECTQRIVSITALAEPDPLTLKLMNVRYQNLLAEFQHLLYQEYTFNNRYFD